MPVHDKLRYSDVGLSITSRELAITCVEILTVQINIDFFVSVYHIIVKDWLYDL
jgi:hypothetical protein